MINQSVPRFTTRHTYFEKKKSTIRYELLQF